MLKFSNLSNCEICRANDILKECEKIPYARINERISLLNELAQFSENLEDWVKDCNVDNVYLKVLMAMVSINDEMSKRFYYEHNIH
jgi:hypothetical protein